MKIFNIYSPTTVSLKTWLILGFVETWHSKSPASEAFVNLSLRVFWPRLRLIHVLFQTFSENITSLPSRHKVKALITNVFLFSYIEWVTIICTHPRHLKEKVMGMLSVISRYQILRFLERFCKNFILMMVNSHFMQRGLMCPTKIAQLYFIYYLQTVNTECFPSCISQTQCIKEWQYLKEHICLPFDLQDWKHGSWRMLLLLAAL